MRFYTWKDMERYCLKKRSQWEGLIDFIEVYPDEMVVYAKEDVTDDRILGILGDVFPGNINPGDRTITLDREGEYMQISFEREYDVWKKTTKPLFEKVIYNESAYPSGPLKELGCPVVAFHSYKGGVGRTLSLLAFARAWTNVHKNDEKSRLLIIDSDLEAPGLTWIQGERTENDFSYLDLLTLIQDMDDMEPVVEEAVREMGSLTVTIEADQREVEHIFLPTFRYDEQLFDLYATPGSVIRGKNKGYVLAEVISRIALCLGAVAVLVDLRAGISEYSAPLFFDPRVKKYIVTSTSYQSVTGTKKLLGYLARGLEIEENANLPVILLSMVPPDLNSSEKEEIIAELIGCFKADTGNEQLLDNLVTELPFASELIHLTKLPQILERLKSRDMYYNIENIVRQYYGVNNTRKNNFGEKQRETMLDEIYHFADRQITAEANGASRMLLTKSVKNLCARYQNHIPAVVIRGAKGSGKTFLYRQLAEKKQWYAFCDDINEKNVRRRGGYILPVVASKSIGQMKEILRECIHELNANLSFAKVSESVYLDNSGKIKRQSEHKTDWMIFWERMIAASVNGAYNSFEQVSQALEKQGEKIVFLIDGLEDILRNVSSDAIQQEAVQVLCQDIVNLLSVKYKNMGIIIFLRSDMAQNAITVNYEQFKQSQGEVELKWSSDEALKLTVWLVGQATDNFYEGSVPVENATRDVIDRHLEKLWGLKLGKNNSNEAYSSRWILAALSDFHGQLQARDMIRFLKNAASSKVKNPSYEDRILMPAEIRKAVSICSEEKIDEIKTEYETLKPIFEKLKDFPQEKKILPLNPEEDLLTPMEEKLMIQAGYLIRNGEKLYLPEIIRHALGFKYERGARPKVLSLILKR